MDSFIKYSYGNHLNFYYGFDSKMKNYCFLNKFHIFDRTKENIKILSQGY